jgi:glycosyltransferase involved in cell wall biosynthesis
MIRKKLGLIFGYNEQWIGGTYYIINLIHALSIIDNHLKPELIILSNEKDYQFLLKQIDYPYISYDLLDENPTSQFVRFLNKVSSKLFGKKILVRRMKNTVDAIFPFPKDNYLNNIPVEKQIYWIPDFQDKQLPQFFTSEDIGKRDKRNNWVAYHSKKLVVSSKAVLRDLEEFYPNYKTNVSVVHFAVTHPKYDNLDISQLKSQYQLPNDYFFAPNQFWAHKNQIIIIKAVLDLKQRGIDFVVAFSGKENDPRNPEYFHSLKAVVEEYGLSENIRFLGFLDREVQLQLMNHSRGVIQPSLFEGWSTVIEDAMAMNQTIIASDLDVNIEQLGEKGIYFERNNHIMLGEQILKIMNQKTIINYNYNLKKSEFAHSLLNLVG